MVDWLLGFLPKFLASFLIGWLKDRRRDKDLKQAGRTERDLEIKAETTDVLGRNIAADNKIAQKTDTEVDEEFNKL